MGKRVAACLGAVVLCLGLSQDALALEARIDGLEGDVADNVRHYLGSLDAAQYGRVRLEGEVLRRTREAMRVYGYYEPQIHQRLEERDPPRHVELVIEPGPQVIIEVLDIRLEGDARNDGPFRDTVEAFPLDVGDPLQHAPWDRMRNRLANLSLERGYFDWNFTDRRMEVRPFDESARLYLALDSGPRYAFGDVTIRGSHILEERLRRMAPFTPGEPYLAGDVALYAQRLGQAGWFSSVSVRPRLDSRRQLALTPPELGWWNEVGAQGEATLPSDRAEPTPPPADGPRLSAEALAAVTTLHRPERPVMPIDVVLAPADRHQFEVAVGYATDVGPRLGFGWEQPWINRYGHSLDHDLFISQPEQRLTGTYLLPLDDPLRDQYRLQYGLRHRDMDDTRTLENTIELARRWEFDNRWVQTLYLRATYEDFTQGGEADSVLIYYPGVSWSRTRTRDPRFPSWGDRQRIAFEYSDSMWGSDADFLRMTGDTEWIRMLGSNLRFVNRLGLGAIETSDFSQVPPSLRFFTGGDRTVRGYGYETLAPRNEEGRLRGGQQLLTASTEVQHRITGNWWGAAFIDTGDAFDDWGPDSLNTGAGLGVRWISPVGPVRFDVAHPFDDEENAWRLHFAIGPEF
ncbi:autotransporter assembly complex protein TamA [Halomonas alkalisoli]|uniref:autotransporter assembly complex protein TamA n=1 Tax=Halomonas alkalisoli TaxID=2907158 RepID=UPI001F46D3CB|nr:autotransporter assembly complex family protein [Halomonas alkalisoli]MCE9684235.1 autotransporter assembly complex protein TamA [Halomonas alkalisoli]